jgi:hypothetical protein
MVVSDLSENFVEERSLTLYHPSAWDSWTVSTIRNLPEHINCLKLQ